MDPIEPFTEDGILNIKSSMKAGLGVIYQEDMHKEQGPDYITKFDGGDGKKPVKKFTLNEYSNNKFSYK